jgi:hypothetical protein
MNGTEFWCRTCNYRYQVTRKVRLRVRLSTCAPSVAFNGIAPCPTMPASEQRLYTEQLQISVKVPIASKPVDDILGQDEQWANAQKTDGALDVVSCV